MHRFILHNGALYEASERLLSPGQVGLLSGWGVFTTIKVIDGVLFAFERHAARMQRDAELIHVPFPPDPGALLSDLERLVAANLAENATLRLVVVRNEGGMWQGPPTGRSYDVIALTAELRRWSREVKLRTIPQARHGKSPFAGVKMLSWAPNLTWLEQAQCDGFEEVLLLDETGAVSECTSANIFASFGNDVFTPPRTAGCLPGITREILLEQVRVPAFRIEERTLYPADLEAADEVFITSTTRELLPVVRIDDKITGTNGKAREALQAAYSTYVDVYVAGHKTLNSKALAPGL